MPGTARPIVQVIREMLRPRAREVIVVGYELSDRDVMHLLEGVASRGTDLVMICDRKRGSVGRVLESWPKDVGNHAFSRTVHVQRQLLMLLCMQSVYWSMTETY